ncbi:MAG: calcium proton exchanger [Lasallia pustulata]|uniref:Vacuolar calcium ion transporter n=1 Tax=Lasallia pustulata TaxID=136370 RepID=A0A5M8PXG8_9LECA|nr:MAG: calcium proton exchanger [Lasallia pustulata]
MAGSRRKKHAATANSEPPIELTTPSQSTHPHSKEHLHLPRYNHNGHLITKGIHPDGESGRKGVHPWHFLRICFRSTSTASKIVNVLWPVVPAAIAIHFARPDLHLWVFSLNYIAMIPAANLVGFAGQELARKLPRVIGVLLETFLGGIVEIVLFMVLLHNSSNNSLIPVIKAAILGSILANLLLCLGFCFLVGGLWRHEQEFHETISEVGNGLMLVAGFGLLIPCAFSTALTGSVDINETQLRADVLTISRATSIALLFAFLLYVWFQMRSHHTMYDEVLGADEEKDEDRHKDLKKDKLTLTECVVALIIALTCVSLHAVFLVEGIEYIVNEKHVSDSFMGLILVPLVEKFAEHLTAIDEAWDNQMNFALAHVLGATIQTALFNSSLVVIVGWGLHKSMDLNFEIFMLVCLILSILVVGNFLRDGKSNYLEGALCVLVYIIIAVTTWYYPSPRPGTANTAEGGAGEVARSFRSGY